MTENMLENRVVLIIGAGRWPGPALALALASQGARVAANDFSPVLTDPICEAARALPGTINAYIADATKGMPLRAMLDAVLEDFGRIDVLINNPRILPTTAIMDMDEWDWQHTVGINLNGPFLVSKLVAQSMLEHGQGTILNIVDTTEACRQPGRAAYAASQTGFLAFSQAAAQELIAYNIRVYTLCPDNDVLHNSQPASEVVSSFVPEQIVNGTLAKMITELCRSSNVKPVEELIKVSHST
jgi:NAD(P)-dependent dehydrogenase (short-subunit alcohol dehydrogenase family)